MMVAAFPVDATHEIVILGDDVWLSYSYSGV